MNIRRAMKQAVMGGLVCLVLAGAWPASAAYVELPGGRRFEGTEIRARANGDINLVTSQGTMTFTKGQYLRAVADRPPEMDQAAQLVRAKKYDDAIKVLNDVVSRFRHLDWDGQAQAMVAKVYFEKGDASESVKAYEKLFALAPDKKDDSALQWEYRAALLADKQYAKLVKQLDETIAGGSRADAAKAQIMRGDVEMAQGNLEPAAFDYLRTVILFKAEKGVQPEALFKAADALEKLRDARAKELYAKLVSEYPSSEFAARARGK